MDEMPELLQIYDTIKTNNLHYCCVCLRTEKERKLVRPVAFQQYIQEFYIHMKNIAALHICFFCEAKARAAVRFQKAAQFAVNINKLFKVMEMKRLRRQILKRFKCKDKTNPLINFDADKCQAELGEIQSLMDLNGTNILFTNCGVAGNTEPMNVLPIASPTKPISDSQSNLNDIIAIDEGTSDKTNHSKNNEFILPNKTNHQVPMAINPLTNLVDFSTNKNQDLYLHPIIFNLDGSSVVPSLNLKILNGSAMPLHLPNQQSSVGDIAFIATLNKNQIATPNIQPLVGVPNLNIKASVGNTFNIPNLNKNQMTTPSQPLAGIPNSNTQSVSPNVSSVTSNSAFSNPNKRLNKEKSDSNILEDILKTNTPLEVITTIIDDDDDEPLKSNTPVEVITTIIDDDDEPVQQKRNRVESGNNSGSLVLPGERIMASVPQRSSNSSRIDWEDKIPMDLISFVRPADTSTAITSPWDSLKILNTVSVAQSIPNVYPVTTLNEETINNGLEPMDNMAEDPLFISEVDSSPMGFITNIRSVQLDDKSKNKRKYLS